MLFDKYDGLNIGCGNEKIESTTYATRFLNVDLFQSEATDLLYDFNSKIWPFSDYGFKHVIARSIIEHVEDPLAFILEVDRILMNGGIFEFDVPFIGSYNHGTDITHKRGFTFQAFNFLLSKDGSRSQYLRNKGDAFGYELVYFWRENVREGQLFKEKTTYFGTTLVAQGPFSPVPSWYSTLSPSLRVLNPSIFISLI